jgi:Protein of unknown function, DUF488
LLAALPAHVIATVVDVRELPLSRKRVFPEKSLALHLELNGVRYIHKAARGCPLCRFDIGSARMAIWALRASIS